MQTSKVFIANRSFFRVDELAVNALNKFYVFMLILLKWNCTPVNSTSEKYLLTNANFFDVVGSF